MRPINRLKPQGLHLFGTMHLHCRGQSHGQEFIPDNEEAGKLLESSEIRKFCIGPIMMGERVPNPPNHRGHLSGFRMGPSALLKCLGSGDHHLSFCGTFFIELSQLC